jgi:hypothetical protein
MTSFVYERHEEGEGIAQDREKGNVPERNGDAGGDEQRANLRARICVNVCQSHDGKLRAKT